VPAVVETYFDAPYIFGTPIAQVLAASGGNEAVDAALDGKTPSTRIYFDPSTVAHTPDLPPTPDLLSGEKKLKSYGPNDESLGDFDLFLMLAARLDLPTALRAADAYKSASQIAYELNGKTCFRASVVGVDHDSNTFLASTLKRWAETMPDAGASPTTAGVVFRSCDPGARAETPSNERIIAATRLVAARDQLVAALPTAGPDRWPSARRGSRPRARLRHRDVRHPARQPDAADAPRERRCRGELPAEPGRRHPVT
jgi:hypothetical protein